MQSYVQVPYIADDGKTYISYQSVISSAQCQTSLDAPDVIRVPSVGYTLAEMIATFESRQKIYEPTSWVPSQLPAVEAMTRSAEVPRVNLEPIVKGLLPLGDGILGRMGEAILGACLDPVGAGYRSRVVEVVDLKSLFQEYATTKDAMRTFARKVQATGQTNDYLALQQIDHWVAHLLQIFLNWPFGSRYATLVRKQDTLVTAPMSSDDPAVQYLQRIFGACELHNTNREATCKEFGGLWTLHALLTAALPPVISQCIIQSVRNLVASVCTNIALCAGAHELVDQEVAAVIVDTLRDW